jgi:hypothetical protein
MGLNQVMWFYTSPLKESKKTGLKYGLKVHVFIVTI